jgi:hypothetical protein
MKLITVREIGSVGLEPDDARECPYWREYGELVSCISRRGGSACGGFAGSRTVDGGLLVVRCCYGDQPILTEREQEEWA